MVVWMFRLFSGTVVKKASRFVLLLVARGATQPFYSWIDTPGRQLGEKHSNEILSYCPGL
jgi:hypothetical protein